MKRMSKMTFPQELRNTIALQPAKGKLIEAATVLEWIIDIAEGSTTPNSLSHIAKLAKGEVITPEVPTHMHDHGIDRRSDEKTIVLRGHMWHVRNDGYRFWVRPAEGNPLIDWQVLSCLEYKYDLGPAADLAELFFRLLPDEGNKP